MIDFEYYNPTRIIFGKNSIHKTGKEFANQGCKNILLLFDSFIKTSGIVELVTESLKKANIHYDTYDQIRPNPLVSDVEKVVSIYKNKHIDGILAIGGGSTIDVAKASSALLAEPSLNLCDVVLGKQSIGETLPVGVVLTIAASGSESSPTFVLTTDEEKRKRSYSHERLLPKFAVLNPQLTYTLPKYQSAAGGCDIMMHTLDRYFSPTKDTLLIDHLSESLVKSVMDALKVCMQEPANEAARSTLMWAGNLSHNGLMSTGKEPDWAPHRLEHELSGKFNVVHGAGLCAIWSSWARHTYQYHIERFVAFAVNIMDVDNDFEHPEQTALKGIERMECFFKEVGMPTRLSDLQIEVSDDDIEDMAEKCLYNTDHLGSFMPLKKENIIHIYKAARGDFDENQ